MRLTRRNADGTLTPIRAHRAGRGQGRRHPVLPLPAADRRGDVRGRRRRRGPQGRLLGRDQARRRARRDRRVAVRDGLAVAARRRAPTASCASAAPASPTSTSAPRRWLQRMYEAWLTRAGSIFGEPLPHAPAAALPGVGDTPPTSRPAHANGNGAARHRERQRPSRRGRAAGDPGVPEPLGRPAEHARAAPSAAPAARQRHRPRDDRHRPHGGRQPRDAQPPRGPARRPRPDATVRLEDLDDALAAELARRIRQARAAGWGDETLADMVEQALGSERHRTPAAAAQGVPRAPRPPRRRRPAPDQAPPDGPRGAGQPDPISTSGRRSKSPARKDRMSLSTTAADRAAAARPRAAARAARRQRGSSTSRPRLWRRFWRCPESWRAHYLARVRGPESADLRRGWAVDVAIEAHYRALLATGDPLPRARHRGRLRRRLAGAPRRRQPSPIDWGDERPRRRAGTPASSRCAPTSPSWRRPCGRSARSASSSSPSRPSSSGR